MIIGSLFLSKVDDFDRYGWSIRDCLIPDAELRLVDEDGNEVPQGITQCFAFDHFLVLTCLLEGELVITSKIISQGYLNFDNLAFSKVDDGRTTFRTGDIYAKPDDEHIIWKGRKDDYIQVCLFSSKLALFLFFFLKKHVTFLVDFGRNTRSTTNRESIEYILSHFTKLCDR